VSKEMDEETLIEIFQKSLLEEEKAALVEDLNPEYVRTCLEIKESCEPFGNEIITKVSEYFYEFFKIIQLVPSILDVERVIAEFKKLKLKGSELKAFIIDNLGEPDELLDFVEEYRLTVENRLDVIEREQLYYQANLNQLPEQSLSIEEIDNEKRLVLTIFNPVQTLIGMNALLNYQLGHLVETNIKIFNHLKKLSAEHQLTTIHIKDAAALNLSEEKREEFIGYVHEDHESLDNLGLGAMLSEDGRENIMDIASELATNLVYRICWSGDFNIKS
jgi:hypothetical protein